MREREREREREIKTIMLTVTTAHNLPSDFIHWWVVVGSGVAHSNNNVRVAHQL